MKKAPLFAIAAAAFLFAGASPALAGSRDHVSFSFGVVVNDGYHHRGHYHDRHCDHDRGYYHRSRYDHPYYYHPRERIVVIDRGHGYDKHHTRHHHRRHHDRHWD